MDLKIRLEVLILLLPDYDEYSGMELGFKFLKTKEYIKKD